MSQNNIIPISVRRISLSTLFDRLRRLEMPAHDRAFVDDCMRLAARNKLSKSHETTLRRMLASGGWQ